MQFGPFHFLISARRVKVDEVGVNQLPSGELMEQTR
jgi:hypothetical protein